MIDDEVVVVSDADDQVNADIPIIIITDDDSPVDEIVNVPEIIVPNGGVPVNPSEIIIPSGGVPVNPSEIIIPSGGIPVSGSANEQEDEPEIIIPNNGQHMNDPMVDPLEDTQPEGFQHMLGRGFQPVSSHSFQRMPGQGCQCMPGQGFQHMPHQGFQQMPHHAFHQGERSIPVLHHYQMPGFVVQCEVHPNARQDVVLWRAAQPGKDGFQEHLLTNTTDLTSAFVGPNQLPQRSNVNPAAVGEILPANIVKHTGYVYLTSPCGTCNAQDCPGVTQPPIVIYHEQTIMGPPNVRFGPINTVNFGQPAPEAPEAREAPEAPESDNLSDSPSEVDSAGEEADDEAEVEEEMVPNQTRREQDAEVTTTSYAESTGKKIKTENVEDETPIPPSDNNESDKVGSGADGGVGSENQETSAGGDHGNQQAVRYDDCAPKGLRNGGMWVAAPGMLSPIRVTGDPDQLGNWMMSHMGQKYDYWPANTQVERIDLDSILGEKPKPSISNDGGSEAAQGSTEENQVENNLSLKCNEKMDEEED
ncbi:uncharacterized protein [Halyomorpha halys]|uniref:uncharacterized protein n=1 Tax=Halyomorpha halys TaxID=286706 RepID=UPI0034D1BE21